MVQNDDGNVSADAYNTTHADANGQVSGHTNRGNAWFGVNGWHTTDSSTSAKVKSNRGNDWFGFNGWQTAKTASQTNAAVNSDDAEAMVSAKNVNHANGKVKTHASDDDVDSAVNAAAALQGSTSASVTHDEYDASVDAAAKAKSKVNAESDNASLNAHNSADANTNASHDDDNDADVEADGGILNSLHLGL